LTLPLFALYDGTGIDRFRGGFSHGGHVAMSTGERQKAQKIGILYQEHSEGAGALARTLAERLRAEGRVAWQEALQKRDVRASDQLPGSDMVLVLGGDGSLLSAARMCAESGIPLLGVNFGRVGFLTELEPAEVEEKLPLYLNGDYWIDERAMLQAEVEDGGEHHQFIALNDMVVVRGAVPRVIRVKVWLDSHYYNTTVADGVIISTATGSTAYNLAAGGPILHPQVRSSVLTPVAPHLAADRSLILEPNAVTTLELQPGSDGAIVSADGQLNVTINAGAQVIIRASQYTTRFLRRRPPTYFYRILSAKLQDNLSG
jgi:NAD+ kinase